jgi:hypothetical protein
MNGIGTERVEPATRVVEPPGLEPHGPSDSGSRRRRPKAPDEPEKAENPEIPPHQVDRLA